MAEGAAHFEFQRMQLITQLGTVAESMRKCANVADQFATMVTQLPKYTLGEAEHQAAPTGKGKRKAQDVEDGDGKKKTRRKREPKDPNAPKRPASSYILFQNEIRKELKEMNPKIPNNELLAIIGKKWTELPEEAKAVYHNAMTTAKDKYILDKAEYDKDKKATGEVTNGAAAVVKPVSILKKTKVTAAAPPKSAPEVPTSTSESGESGTEASSPSSGSEEEEEVEEEVEAEEPPAKKAKKAAPPATKPSKKATRA